MLDFEVKPLFARYADGVLDMGSIKITLPNVQDIDAYRDMTITWNRTTYMKLGTLLDAAIYGWTVEQVDGTTTAKYGSEDTEPEIVLIGLKDGLTAEQVTGGITFNPWQIILSTAILGNSEVNVTFDINNRSLFLYSDAAAEYSEGWTFDEESGVYQRAA